MRVHAMPQEVTPGVGSTHNSKVPVADRGAETYARHCAICHGEQREGNLPGFPSLLGIQRRMNKEAIAALIHTGKGRMPAFPSLADGELQSLLSFLTAQPQAADSGEAVSPQTASLQAAGHALFEQNCAFCHGRDAMGGESGPDLTRSKLVRSDKSGDKISKVVREGRPDSKMPAFNFSSQELTSLIAFLHGRVADAEHHKGARRGVDPSDLQTGNAAAGKQYFNGAGGCAKCHSATGDLAGIASRYQGLELEERMLYPRGARSTVTLTLPSGQTITGSLAYRDEFTIALRDGSGTYRSWPASRVRYEVSSPAEAHVELFRKYSDDDIHNLMAYLQTLR